MLIIIASCPIVGGNNAFFGVTMGSILLPIWGTTLYNRK
jgi:hypothetical protein